jgi:hypothetical protein
MKESGTGFRAEARPLKPVGSVMSRPQEYQSQSPACRTVNVWPAIVSVPVRGAAGPGPELEFAATLNVTVPLPVPDAPPVTEIHDAPLAADHVHVPADAVTVTDPPPPALPTSALVGEIVNVHGGGGGGGGAAAWFTVNV